MAPGLPKGSSRPSGLSIRSLRSHDSHLSIAGSAGESEATSVSSLLPALQNKGGLAEHSAGDLEPLPEADLDPGSFDIVAAPPRQQRRAYSLVERSRQLFSKEHMSAILGDSRLLSRFSHFLAAARPRSLPLLTYYLDAEKAIRALDYANSVAAELSQLSQHDFTHSPADEATSHSLRAKRDAAFDLLTREELPRFITHVWIRVVSLSVRQRVTGTMPAHLRDASSGLAEVFCLSDPSREDNPIILTSSEFHRTTQYGTGDVIGRNCRFLQGPGTNPFSVRRIREKIKAGKEHFETFLNYRRDGSAFMNLLLCAPLIDSRGTIRYFLGAQVDVSGLARECTDLEGLRRLVVQEEEEEEEEEGGGKEEERAARGEVAAERSSARRFREMSEMLSRAEVETVRRHGGTMHEVRDENALESPRWERPYLMLEDAMSPIESPPSDDVMSATEGQAAPSRLQTDMAGDGADVPSGRLPGIYENYLLVRPAPSFQILFASPTLRLPGMLQSPLLSRIGGSGRVRDQLAQALTEGRGVTAKVRWLLSRTTISAARLDVSSGRQRDRSRWLHCTPLRGINGAIGVWMIVVVNDHDESPAASAPRSIVHGKFATSPAGHSRRVPPVDVRYGGRPAGSGWEDDHAESRVWQG